MTLPSCPKCQSQFVYEDGELLVCPECAHEWTAGSDENPLPEEVAVRDAFGTILAHGDTVTFPISRLNKFDVMNYPAF